MRSKDLSRMPVAGAEVGRTRPGEDVRGLAGAVLQQVCVHAAPVAEQAFPSALGGLGADQQHQAWGMGKPGAFCVRGEFAVTESGISGPACVAWDAADRGQSVGVAVAVCGHRHDSGGERQHIVAGGELVEGDETVLAQLLGDLGRSARGCVIEEVLSEKITGAHRRAPSSAVSGSTVESGGPAGKATDCRLGQIAWQGGQLPVSCYGPKSLALPRDTRNRMTYTPPTWPVSVKGVALDGRGRVLLLKNERQEWELPGGRLEADDPSPEHTVERELHEESGWSVNAGPLLDTWIYQPLPQTRPERRVVIITYGCTVLTPEVEPVVSHEHQQIGLFTASEVPALTMPDGYKQSIAAWYGRM